MIGPSSQISKILLTLLLLLVIFYIFMDINLYLRIQNYPIERNYHINSSVITLLHERNSIVTTQFPQSSISTLLGVESSNTIRYSNVTWINCHINPLCDVVSEENLK